MKAGHWVQHK